MTNVYQQFLENLAKFVRDLRAYLTTLPKPSQAAPAVPSATPAPQSVPEPIPAPPTPVARPDYLTLMATAITNYEGGLKDLNHINNNPGNLRSWPTQIGSNKGFAVFKTWADGMTALRMLLTNAATGKSPSYKPTMTLLQFFAAYSPSSDGNNPAAYANFVARQMKVDTGWQIKSLIA